MGHHQVTQDLSQEERFPPSPDHEHEYQAILSAFRCTLGNNRVTYVSAPITGGKRFVEWFCGEGHSLATNPKDYATRFCDEVKARNIETAQQFTDQLRTGGEIAISPAAFDIPHWTQNDYRHLWGLVIRDHVRRVFFLDGWEYSNGCAFEFYTAINCDVQVLTEGGTAISRVQGFHALEHALDEKRRAGLSLDFLMHVISGLSSKF